jgi:hypothetical protein
METQAVKITKRLCGPRQQADINNGDLFLLVKEDKEKGKLTLKRHSQDKKTIQISKSRFEWEVIGKKELCKNFVGEMEQLKKAHEFDVKKMIEEKFAEERKKYDERCKAIMRSADHGENILNRYTLSKMTVCENMGANAMDAFCDQCAKEKNPLLVKLCRTARMVGKNVRKPLQRMTYDERKGHEYFIQCLKDCKTQEFQLWNMCNVAVNNSEFKGCETVRTLALVAWFWLDLARDFYHKAQDILPTLNLKMNDPDALKGLAYAAIGEGVEMPDFTIMKGVYSNILAEIIK